MYAKVIKPFNDKKNACQRREPGEVFLLNKDRFAEIEKAVPGLIEECEKPEEPEPDKEQAAGNADGQASEADAGESTEPDPEAADVESAEAGRGAEE